MSNSSPINLTIIESNIYHYSLTSTTNVTDSFNHNVITTKQTFNGGNAPPLEPTLSVPRASSSNNSDVHSSSNPHDTILQTGQTEVTPRRMSSSINVENIYPPASPAPRFNTQAFKFQSTPHPYPGLPSGSFPESLGSTRNTIPTTQENLCQHIFTKIKQWIDKLLGYLFKRHM